MKCKHTLTCTSSHWPTGLDIEWKKKEKRKKNEGMTWKFKFFSFFNHCVILAYCLTQLYPDLTQQLTIQSFFYGFEF